MGAVPASAAASDIGSISSDGSAFAGSVDIPNAEEGAGKPEDRGEEGKSNISLPSLANALLGDIAPIKDGTAVEGTDKLNREAEGNQPSDKEKKIDWPVDESTSEGDKPEEREQYRKRGNGFSVDEATFGPISVALVPDGVEIIASDTSDNSSKG